MTAKKALKKTGDRTLIIYAHPYDGSFNHAVLEAATSALDKAGRPKPPRSGPCQPCGDHLQSRLCGIGDHLRPGRSAWMGLLQAPVRRWPDAAEDTGEGVQAATGRHPITPDRGHSAQPGACRFGRGHSTPSGTAIPSPNARDVPDRKKVSLAT